MKLLELNDIQAYVMEDYKSMLFSRYALIRVVDAGLAKQWLADNVTHIIAADELDTKEASGKLLNIAFTAQGLKALGMYEENVHAFSREFREGMITEHRIRLLGDIGSSSPDLWQWGNPANEEVHILMLVFGKDEETCLQYYNELAADFMKCGMHVIKTIDGRTLKDNKEHFGFRDGISQPLIAGSGKEGPARNTVQAGEFIMGYTNEYNVLPQSPLILTEQGDINLLPSDSGGSGKKDLGKNGTYLVVRQMDQDVNAFWTFMNNKTRNKDGSLNKEESLKLSAKIIGRWPSGAPVTKFPDADPGGISDDNDFGYAEEDGDGLKCPFGAHLRRANPRDSFEENTMKESLKLSNRHRIIRRARLYGEPIIGSPDNHSPNGDVGLLFNCFNADISRQFEFLQYTWANFPKIKELYNDPDPIIGVQENPEPGVEQNFTIQGNPVNKTVKGLERFVKIRGGAYFFFPSLTAIRYIASI